MVQIHLGPPSILCGGGVAQLGERLPCTQEAIGSIPFTSTRKKGGGGTAPTMLFDNRIGNGFDVVAG